MIGRKCDTLIAIDTKWKRIGLNPENAKRGVPQADAYQMMIYARLYRCPDVMLLCPHHSALGRATLDAAYGMLAGPELLRIASIDLRHGDAAVVRRPHQLIFTAVSRQEACRTTHDEPMRARSCDNPSSAARTFSRRMKRTSAIKEPFR